MENIIQDPGKDNSGNNTDSDISLNNNNTFLYV